MPRPKRVICEKDHSSLPIAIMSLPDSQRSAWRHKCAACAFELGYQLGLQRAKARRAAK
jgi:hypothetical protein